MLNRFRAPLHHDTERARLVAGLAGNDHVIGVVFTTPCFRNHVFYCRPSLSTASHKSVAVMTSPCLHAAHASEKIDTEFKGAPENRAPFSEYGLITCSGELSLKLLFCNIRINTPYRRSECVDLLLRYHSNLLW